MTIPMRIDPLLRALADPTRLRIMRLLAHMELAVGELAVWVGAAAAHRDAAFAACRYVIDQVKARVPIWKHERYADGRARWLHPDPASPVP